MNGAEKAGVGVVTAVIGVAILAVLLSSKSTTTGVIQTAASALGNLLGVVVAPISTGAAAAAPASGGASGTGPQASAGGGLVGDLTGTLNGLTGAIGQLPSLFNSAQNLGNSLTSLAGIMGATQ